MPYSDPDKRRAYEKQWRERNREKSREANRKSYFKHHEKNLERSRQKNAAGKQYAHDWHQANKERRMVRVKERYQTIPEVRARRNAEMKRWTSNIRLEVFGHYGNKCACCGEREMKFLSIDHIGGGGNKHRKAIGKKAGVGFYAWLKSNDYPDGYRLLCFNCNMARGFHGNCPHE